MNDKLKAKEILDYCISYLTGSYSLKEKDYKNSKQLYNEMLKEIDFMINTD